MIVSNKYDDFFYAASETYDVPFTWLKAIAGAESDWRPDAYRYEAGINDASYGLMQILYRTAYALGYRGDPSGLYDPQTNINLGAKLIQENIQRFGSSFEKVYSAYNSGSPTKYLTNADVASHVDRARRYLAEVEQSTVVVEGDSGPSGGAGAAGGVILALVIGVAVFLATRGH